MRYHALIGATLAVLLLTLSSCMPAERLIRIASTDDSETALVFGLDLAETTDSSDVLGHPIGHAVTIHDYTDSETCDHTIGLGMTFPHVMVRDAATGKVLWRAPLDEFNLCHGDRLVWDGELVIRLGEDDPWPDGVIVPEDDDIQRYPDYS